MCDATTLKHHLTGLISYYRYAQKTKKNVESDIIRFINSTKGSLNYLLPKPQSGGNCPSIAG
jgi:hypothetical protein